MSGRPYMKWYAGDYLRDTMHLTTRQHGAYRLLIDHHWLHMAVPDDDAQLAAITRETASEWAVDKPIVMAFFRRIDGVWIHKRVNHELRVASELIAKRRKAGQLGGIHSGAARRGEKTFVGFNGEALASHVSKQMLRSLETSETSARSKSFPHKQPRAAGEANGSEAFASIVAKQMGGITRTKEEKELQSESVSREPVDNSGPTERATAPLTGAPVRRRQVDPNNTDPNDGLTDEAAFKKMKIEPLLGDVLKPKAVKDGEYRSWLARLGIEGLNGKGPH